MTCSQNLTRLKISTVESILREKLLSIYRTELDSQYGFALSLNFAVEPHQTSNFDIQWLVQITEWFIFTISAKITEFLEFRYFHIFRVGKK